MVKNIIAAGIISISLIACNSSEQTSKKQSKQEAKSEVSKEIDEVKVDANRVLTMELEGMVCSMGCGGSIRKELKATGAVANCEFDFEDERAIDVAKIEFDKDKISVDEIVEIVGKINDGQFTVGETSSEVLDKSEIKEDKVTSSNISITKMQVASSSFRFPNFFDLFADLLSF